MSSYEENRATLSANELQKYRGKWVAFRPDGTGVVASADTLPDLEQRLVAAGEDPQRVLLDRIEDDDTVLGGAELS